MKLRKERAELAGQLPVELAVKPSAPEPGPRFRRRSTSFPRRNRYTSCFEEENTSEPKNVFTTNAHCSLLPVPLAGSCDYFDCYILVSRSCYINWHYYAHFAASKVDEEETSTPTFPLINKADAIGTHCANRSLNSPSSNMLPVAYLRCDDCGPTKKKNPGEVA